MISFSFQYLLYMLKLMMLKVKKTEIFLKIIKLFSPIKEV